MADQAARSGPPTPWDRSRLYQATLYKTLRHTSSRAGLGKLGLPASLLPIPSVSRTMSGSNICLLAVALSVPAGTGAQERPVTPLTTARADAITVRPGDVLRITVWPDQSLSGDFPIEDSGMAYLPMVGGILAAGRPLNQLRADLRARLGEAFQMPVVSITPVFRVSVLGAVLRPGLYEVTPSENLFDVISMAGGFTARAKTEDVRLIRDGQLYSVNARATLETGEDFLGVQLQSGDRIVVPEGSSLTARDVLTVLQSIGLVVTLAITLSR